MEPPLEREGGKAAKVLLLMKKPEKNSFEQRLQLTRTVFQLFSFFKKQVPVCIKTKVCWSHLSYHVKNWNGKKYPFANVELFCHLIWKMFTAWTPSGNAYLLAFVKDIEINVARMKFTYIKCQNKFTFANGYFFPFQVL